MDYALMFYLLLGVNCGLVVRHAQSRLIRRRFERVFGFAPGRHVGFESYREVVGTTLRGLALLVNHYQKNHYREKESVLRQRIAMVRLEKDSLVMRDAKRNLKSMAALTRQTKRDLRRARRELNRGQRLAKHFGFNVDVFQPNQPDPADFRGLPVFNDQNQAVD